MNPDDYDIEAIHPRVLEVGLEGHQEWALACWADPGPQSLRDQLSHLVEVTLLAELSQPPTQAAIDRNFRAVQLLAFDELGDDSRAVLGAFGFQPIAYEPDKYTERMSAWNQEAIEAGRAIPASPAAVFKAEVRRPDEPIADKLDMVHTHMVDKLDGEAFGQTPGGPSKLMATYIRQQFNTSVTPNRDGVHSLELFLVQEAPRTLRWMPPGLFQGLCDFAGVVLLQSHPRLEVQWAVSEPDEAGAAPPPTFRIQTDAGCRRVPIGQLMTRWCIMPRQDDPPTLADRIDGLAEGDSRRK